MWFIIIGNLTEIDLGGRVISDTDYQTGLKTPYIPAHWTIYKDIKKGRVKWWVEGM